MPGLQVGQLGPRPQRPAGVNATPRDAATPAETPGAGGSALERFLAASGGGGVTQAGIPSSIGRQIAERRLYGPQPLPGRGGQAQPAASGGGGDVVNTASSDPRLGELWNAWKQRMDSSNTGRAIDQSNAAIADSAALLGKDAKALLASRGVGTDTGVGSAFVQRNITAPAQRAAAGAAASIAQGEQQRLDSLVSAGLPIARAPGDQAQASQALALQQFQAGTSADLARQQLAMQAERDRLSQQMAIAQLLAGL